LADTTLTLVPWAPGTPVSAYPRRSEQLRPDGPPTGVPPTDTQIVADDASLTYDVADGEYWAAAPINGSDHWQYVAFVAELPFSEEGHALAAARSENGHWHEVMVDDIGRLSTVDIGPSQPPHGPPPYATLGDIELSHEDIDAKLQVHLNDYLPSGFVSGVTDCTAAIQAWGVAAQAVIDARGGVRLVAAPGVYNFTSVIGAEMVRLENGNGVAVEATGATFADQRAYGAPADKRAWLFRLYDCHSVKGRLRVTCEVQTYAGSELPNGLVGMAFYEGCTDMDVALDMVGGREGVSMMRLSGDPTSWVSHGAKLVIRTDRTFYSYSGQFSGNEIEASIDANAPGRALLIYGVQNNTFKVRCKDQALASPISMYGGQGCSNITVFWYDHESTNPEVSGVQLHYRVGNLGQLGTHSKIKIDFDVKQGGARTFLLLKTVSDTDGATDSTGRGHVLDGLELSGIIEMTNGNFRDVIGHGASGEMVAPDIMRGLHFHDLTIRGSQARVLFRATCLQDRALMERVQSSHDFLIENLANSQVYHAACQAVRLSQNALDTHHYDGCYATGTNALGLSTKTYNACAGTGLLGLKPPGVANNAAAGTETLYVSSEYPNKLVYKDNNGNPIFLLPRVYSGALDVNYALAASDRYSVLNITGALTANRTMTLGTAGMKDGMTVRVAHRATGGFSWDLGGLKTLTVNQWAEAMYTGSAWVLIGFGSL
jgi:hypothetical protein